MAQYHVVTDLRRHRPATARASCRKPAAEGLPELFAWGAPDTGVDPGEHWVLSPGDLHGQLHQAAVAWTGRGRAVLDVAPDVVATLPAQHRAA